MGILPKPSAASFASNWAFQRKPRIPATRSEAGRRDSAVHLSARQAQVLRLIAEGKTNREIAELPVLSERTVQRHIADLYTKISVRNRSEATSYALNLPTAVDSPNLQAVATDGGSGH